MEILNSKMYILASELNYFFVNKHECNKSTILKEIEAYFPNLKNSESEDLLNLLEIQWQNNKALNRGSEFVVTLPLEIEHDFRRTIGVLREYIVSAKKSILITGYAISDYVQDIIDLLIYKTSKGVEVTFIIDRDIDECIFERAIKFKIYKFNSPNSHSHLHAKLLIFDGRRAFVSSSNLSYNGILNNIEVGTLITNDEVQKLEKTFKSLINSNYFFKIN